MPKEKGLTLKQQRFIREFLIDLNAAAAARRAGYSARIANQLGYELLRKPAVQQAIEQAREQINAELVMSRQEVLERLTLLGRADPRSLYRADGTLKPPHELDDVGAATLAGIEIEQGPERQVLVAKVKHRDPIKALELLGKHHALWADQPPPPPEGPGLTVIVQQGVEVNGQRVVHGTRVKVELPGPE